MLSFDEILKEYPEIQRLQERNILKEYLQYQILDLIAHSEYANKLCFLGGTALRLIYQNPRFSEDLDFDNSDLSQDEFQDIAKEIEKGLELRGFEVETNVVHKGGFRCYIRFPKILFDNNLSPLEGEKVLVQIDSVAQGFEYDSEIKIINKFEVATKIRVVPLDLILSQKIYAIFNRPRTLGRDFFDVVYILSKNIKVNYDYLKAKMGVDNSVRLR
ncbi:MAG: nucleotidyl transferase AbiEii/AbiGii toxin family protein, partial [bacterium]|nr:nucleotidyl transferase AbiEii/AbiGii toxin family protein [bacterium]